MPSRLASSGSLNVSADGNKAGHLRNLIYCGYYWTTPVVRSTYIGRYFA